jgi:hypothetical protein
MKTLKLTTDAKAAIIALAISLTSITIFALAIIAGGLTF